MPDPMAGRGDEGDRPLGQSGFPLGFARCRERIVPMPEHLNLCHAGDTSAERYALPRSENRTQK